MATVQASAAAEVKVLTAGAFKQIVLAVVPEFEKSGHKLVVDNDTVGALVKRIEGGEAFDVAVLTPAAVDELTGKGKIASGSKTDPVKFEEFWTFTRPVGNNPWRLSAINQK